ncbi:MAG: hypothetical protein JWM81_316 [Candidatus Saccharibacteria bacterium]|nr:hypothetical protein [Candidatus Saccharibacteria bacterium]
MTSLRKRQQGFSAVELLLGLVVLALIISGGFYVYKRGQDSASSKASSSSATTDASAVPKTAPVIDPTTGWASHTEPSGKFSLKYPSSWATAQFPEYCVSNDGGIFMLGPDTGHAGKCGSEAAGEVTFSWTEKGNSVNKSLIELDPAMYASVSSKTVTIDGVSAKRDQGTVVEHAAPNGFGDIPSGTIVVDYTFTKGGLDYKAQYMQQTSDPDVLKTFDTILTASFKFSL